ncbi:helix-turn-helix domain-containing protein [Oricola sp.]|uniref:helix-turn-helix domain-containing protein n=1 Tax=Oricola sp. TaxID=1979950 RepID=UPI003BAA65BD
MTSSIDFPKNLRLLSSRYKSVTEVCTRIGINRPQFTRYLSGQTSPSLNVLSRICDFFGVDEAEILLPHETFKAEVFSRPLASYVPMGIAQEFRRHRHRMKASLAGLQSYCGYYHLYYRTPSWKGGVVRALTQVWQDSEMTYAKSLDRMHWSGSPKFGRATHMIQSCLWLHDDRIFMIESQERGGENFSAMIVKTATRTNFHYLHGLLTGVTSTGTDMIYSTRVVWESLGADIDVKAALKQCAVFPPDAEEIDPMILRALSTEGIGDGNALTGFFE